ncbi:MAG TPA: VWA domain-containing protein [Vicinamibacterales bacterium]|nr:VWA domain-containing protein [Vicinamibacterales bacterium]
MTKGRLRLAYCALAAMLAAPLALGVNAQDKPAPPAQPAAPPATDQTPVFRSDINFVRVDVIVNDRQGNLVQDLKQEDFEVTEDGKPQSIQTFKLINVSEDAGVGTDPPREIRNAVEEQTEAARDDVRLFAIFLDDYHVRLENSMRAREHIARFVENQLNAKDMAGVMYPLWSINDVMLARNRMSLAAAIRGFTGRKYDYTPRNAFEERYVHYVPTIEAERIRNEVSLSALKGLIVRLGGLREGRKAIVLISEGYTNTLPPQMNDQVATCNGMACGNQPRPRPDPVGGASSPMQQRMESQDFFSQAQMMSDLKMVIDLANRYNVAIYPVDPRGLAPFEFDLSTAGQAAVSLSNNTKMLDNTMDTLRILADETDGRALVNTNDMDKGLKQIVRDTSAYYLIGYTSAVQTDGKFHKINVRLKRPGLQVRARPGYLALSPAEAERSLAPKKPGPPQAVAEALGTLAATAQQRRNLIRSWVGMSPGAGGKTKISFVWNPSPAVSGVRGERAASVSLLAGGANSELHFRRKAIAPGRVEFEVPPGPIELEIAVEDASAEVLDREIRKINVPSLGLGLTLSTPEVFRGRTLPEWQVLAADAKAIPVVEREFRRTDRLLVRVAAQSAAGTPTLSARMLNRDGGEMSVLPVTPAGFGAVSQIDVPLSPLPPGDFLIEVMAKDGGEQASTYVAFRVTP